MPRVYGKKVVLREYRKEDLGFMREWVNDPETVRNLDDVFICPHTQNMTEDYLNRTLENKAEGEIHFVIADPKTDAYIGQIALMHIDWRNRVAMLGIVIAKPENRKRGCGREAIGLILDFAFRQVNLHRVELNLRDYNTIGYNLYLKCGFKEEGRRRKDYYIDGEYTDSILMGILKEEFTAG